MHAVRHEGSTLPPSLRSTRVYSTAAANAVHIVIAMDEDDLIRLKRALQPLDRGLHTHQCKRIEQLLDPWLQKEFGLVDFGETAAVQQTAEESRQLERLFEGGNGLR